MKRQLAQVGATDGFRMVENGFEVETITRDCRYGFAGYGGGEYTSVPTFDNLERSLEQISGVLL